jgi:glycosyltransferase involved in cell wall biosynthesis
MKDKSVSSFGVVVEGRQKIAGYAWEFQKQEFHEKVTSTLGVYISSYPFSGIDESSLNISSEQKNTPSLSSPGIAELPDWKKIFPARNKIGIVICRYAEEISGGAESLAGSLAEKLAACWDVDILTTCALDYNSWKSVYPPGITQSPRGFRILRFEQEEADIQALSDAWFRAFDDVHQPADEKEWLRLMGPESNDLFRYIQEKQNEYGLFLFIGYLWATSSFGMAPVAHKSILLPAAHNEPAIHLGIYRQLVNSPAALIYLTPEEKLMVNQLHGNAGLDSEIIPLGLQVNLEGNESEFRAKTGITDPYLLYLGRVDEGKGCRELIQAFQDYKKLDPNPLKLVLAGQVFMEIPGSEDIISLGFVDEATKGGALAGAKMLINPSARESLSLVILESWLREIPVLVNGKSHVMRAQCLRSNGGIWYQNSWELIAGIKLLMESDKLRQKLGKSGHEFVVSLDYQWDYLLLKFQLLAKRVIADSKAGKGLNPLREYLRP